jgi:3-oxoacyl-[acyl-carrier-protein] synthase III
MMTSGVTTDAKRLRLGGAMLGVRVVGVGACAAPNVITNDRLSELLDTSDEWIFTRTGIRERRLVGGDVTLADLAAGAAQDALRSAGLGPADIDFIIACTSTPDTVFPALCGQLQAALGMPHAGGFDLSLACSGFVAGMATAEQFLRTGLYRRILVVGADVLSRYVDWSDRSTCVLFGDGAGACIMEASETEDDVLARNFQLDGAAGHQLCLKLDLKNAPYVAPKTPVSPHLTMNGREVFRFATRVAPQAVADLLEACQLKADHLDWLVLHQANVRIMQLMTENLGIPPEKMVVNLDRYGNTSAASIPMALNEAVMDGRIKKGQLVATCGFGGGLSWVSMLFRWSVDDQRLAAPGA